MKEAQLNKMTVPQLRELSARIESALVERKQRDKAALKAKLKGMAEKAGVNLKQVIGARRKSTAAAKGKARPAVIYQHPRDPNLTWSGRGRRPKWLGSAANIEKYRVK